jgi:ABC-type cobalamin/Fe3+-siderophores transport system ATPase subunit
MLEDLTRALGGEAGKSVVVSTHDTTQARALGARVIALEDGRVVLSEEMARD